MSNSKSYLIEQKYHNATILLKDQNTQTIRNFNKIATLQPYMADIQKKHKLRQKLNKNTKNKNNQSSSRSFRIKDVSTSSLHKLNFIDVKGNHLSRNKQTINTTGVLVQPKKIKPTNNNDQLMGQRKAKSQNARPFQSSFSKTINTKEINQVINAQQATKQLRANEKESIQGEKSVNNSNNNNNVFNDYLLRRTKDTKPQQKFRKNMYEIMLPKKNSVTEKANSGNSESIKKISYTQLHIEKSISQKHNSHQQIDFIKRTQQVRRNNFRKGKYEMNLHSSVNENTQTTQQLSHDPLHSERVYPPNGEEGILMKKDSTLSINRQMDILAEKEMLKFYRQVRTKEIQKSLQKSTQKYFGCDSYRPVKSKNQIQIYVSSIINPSIHKISQSTRDKQSTSKNKSPILQSQEDYYAYNFDFEFEKNNILLNHQQQHQNQQKINQMMENSEEYEESMVEKTDERDFEKQRKNAEIQFFQKDTPKIDWSDDDCQVDDISL